MLTVPQSMTSGQFDHLLAFALFAFVASVTPGPNNVILTATGSQVGLVRGLPTLFGITIGFAIMVFILTLGLGTAMLARPDIMLIMRFAGIAMLVWLSWQIAVAPVAVNGTADADTATPPIGLIGGAMFQWVNPKAWMVVASAISAYMVPDYPALQQAAGFGVVFFVSGVIACLLWLGFGAAMKRLLRTQKSARWFNRLMGLLLLSTIVFIIR